MIRFALCMTLTALAAVAMAEDKPAAADALPKTEEGYIDLFNGEDLEGWEIFANKDDFKIQDGVIHCETGDGGQILYYTKEAFEDFILVVEWRVSKGGNSGVFFRAPKVEAPWIDAWEVQISNEQPPRDDAHTTGSLYNYAAVSPRIDATPEEWHTFTIRCEGGQIQVQLDGTQIVEYDQASADETKDKPLKGFVGLQDSHGPAGTWIEYRTIKIKPLP
jgi:hypothetical protein